MCFQRCQDLESVKELRLWLDFPDDQEEILQLPLSFNKCEIFPFLRGPDSAQTCARVPETS